MTEILCKTSVRFSAFGPAMLRLLTVLHAMLTHPDVPPSGLVITSANDSGHMQGSRHYSDEAIDVRSKTFASRAAKERFRRAYEQALGPSFRVLLEGLGTDQEHFHAQVRKGHVYDA